MRILRIKPLDLVLATAEKKPLHRSLGLLQLTLVGVGAIIGTGIFVLTAEAAQKAGPGMMISFIVAGLVCAPCSRSRMCPPFHASGLPGSVDARSRGRG